MTNRLRPYTTTVESVLGYSDAPLHLEVHSTINGSDLDSRRYQVYLVDNNGEKTGDGLPLNVDYVVRADAVTLATNILLSLPKNLVVK